MVTPAVISISGTQHFKGEDPETIQLVSQGSYSYEPGYISISYEETEMTGLEGTVTTFTIEDESRVTLQRTGKLQSKMTFVVGQRDDSLYDAGFGGLLLSVCARQISVLMNEHGGIFDLEYSIDIEHTACGVNSYHIEVHPTMS